MDTYPFLIALLGVMTVAGVLAAIALDAWVARQRDHVPDAHAGPAPGARRAPLTAPPLLMTHDDD